MYDPKVGRWLSEDPLGFKAGDENLYRYVGNGPTNDVDPMGLAPGDVEDFIEGFVEGSGLGHIFRKPAAPSPIVPRKPPPSGIGAVGGGAIDHAPASRGTQPPSAPLPMPEPRPGPFRRAPSDPLEQMLPADKNRK
jgi:uncharacterized protein RhaS with RHS repeats